MRHGRALYEQKKVLLDDAADLHPEGVATVERSAHEYADRLPSGSRVRMLSSPYGRTLHTAKLVRSVLQARGLQCSAIVADERVEEVRNLKGRVLNSLMNGGTVEIDGREFHVDAALTNPRGMPYPAYYVESEFLRIEPVALAALPEVFVAAFRRFETFPDVTARVLEVVGTLLHGDGDEHVLITTHDACVGFPVKVFTDGRRLGLEPGIFVVLTRHGEDVVVDTVQGEPEGRAVALHAEFARHYGDRPLR